ncbi:outer membrane lipoprotein-sorting protein [bacterium]|nr:outer membrane lipoprotein-sorting protein [bacterium]
MKRIVILITLTLCFLTESQGQTAKEWLDRIDANMAFMTAEFTAKMTVHHPNGQERMFRFVSKVREDKFALMEFVDPPRERGTRYLKREGNLWIYFPRQDRTLQIQGHMLREGVQGGDFSYEDLTESRELEEMYNASIESETDTTLIIFLEAKDMTVSYPFQLITIDKVSSLPVQQLYSGIGNTPIKEMIVLETLNFGKRKFPTKMEIRSLLVDGKWTKLEFEAIEFGVELPPDIFTKESLEKKH